MVMPVLELTLVVFSVTLFEGETFSSGFKVISCIVSENYKCHEVMALVARRRWEIQVLVSFLHSGLSELNDFRALVRDIQPMTMIFWYELIFYPKGLYQLNEFMIVSAEVSNPSEVAEEIFAVLLT